MTLPDAIKFDELMANPTVMQALKENVAAGFAEAAGVHVGYVTVTFAETSRRRLDARKTSLRRLVAGGVRADAEIVAPAGQSPSDLQTAIETTGASGLADKVVTAVLATPDIANAAPGGLASRADMVAQSQASYSAPTLTTVTMTLAENSPLATAALSNGNAVTTTGTPTAGPTQPAAATTTAAQVTNATTTALPAEGVLGGSRTLAVMTVSTAAALLIAVSA